MLKTAVAIRHVHFEDLGVLEAVLPPAGYKLQNHDVAAGDLSALDPDEPDLLIVLGGTVGVYETDAYPFLLEEQALIYERVRRGLPIMGICLGAQQIAAALGAKVAPCTSKEIGFAKIDLNAEGLKSPLRHLMDVPVLHWHGGSFETPPGGTTLAANAKGAAQAFAIGSSVMGVQFHPEVDACTRMEEWLLGHAIELALAGVCPSTMRQEARQHGPLLRKAGRRMFTEWLMQLG